MTAPFEGPATNENQIEVSWTALTGDDTGNSEILSYNLYWDHGTGTTDIFVIDSLVTSTIISGVTPGSTYKFKVRAKNIYNYGTFSDETTIKASDVPATMEPISTIAVL